MVVVKKSRKHSSKRLAKTQRGGFKNPSDEELNKLQKFIKYNLIKFHTEYEKFLNKDPIFNMLIKINEQRKTVAEIHENKLLFTELEVISAICKEIIRVFEIQADELKPSMFTKEPKYKFLYRLSTKCTDQYCEIPSRNEKTDTYIEELNKFINEKLDVSIKKSGKKIIIARVPGLRQLNYKIKTSDDVMAMPSESRASSRNTNAGTSRRSEPATTRMSRPSGLATTRRSLPSVPARSSKNRNSKA
jgi:hypothetical protein